MNDAEQRLAMESVRAIVHELRNISFGLQMTVDEVSTEAAPDPESVRHLRRLASRLGNMADIVHQLSEPLTATVAPLRVDLVVEALGERFPESSLVRIGPRDLVARADAQLLLRALAQLIAAHAAEQVDVTIAVAGDEEDVRIEIGSARPEPIRRTLGSELARRLLGMQGGRLDFRSDGPAFVVTLPRAHDGEP